MNRATPLLATLLIAAGLVAGCATDQKTRRTAEATRTGVRVPAQAVAPTDAVVHRMAVLPFGVGPSRTPGGAEGMATDPLTGMTFAAGHVSDDAGRIVADQFRTKLIENGFTLLPEGMVDEAAAALPADPADGYSLERAAAVGRATGADVVVIGSVMRYEELVGTSLAAEKPASVAFAVVAVHSHDGTILWKAKFDKTQQALFEDLRQLGSFFKGGMVWQSAIEFAAIGVDETLKRMPLRPAPRERSGGE